MSTTRTPAALSDPAVGDHVVLTDEDSPPSLVGIIDRREVPAIGGPGGREQATLVRVPDGRWFNLADGRDHLGRGGRITFSQQP